MPDLWDGGQDVAISPERDGPERSAADVGTRSPRLYAESASVSREIAEPVAFGLEGAYGPGWPQPYGTAAGRTLTGATPDEAFPRASTEEQQRMRDALVGTFDPERAGADHPEMEAALRGALADGMTREDRATVNQAALDAAVARDPEALLDIPPTIPRDQIQAWQDLAQKPFPSAVTDRMDAMNAAIQDRRQTVNEIRDQYREPNERVALPAPALWRPLDVENAAGGVVNMDYYPVRVRLPDGVDPAAVLNHVRRNLDDFVDTSKSSFAAYPDGEGNTDNVARWNSARPTGSFVTIDIPVNDGTVAVIDSGADHWTFATVQSPGDGLHPVSGNRDFGYTENEDGSVTFYTRGVDRITDGGSAFVNRASQALLGGPGVAFEKADQLWQSFQQGVADYVEARGGTADVQDRISIQPDWNRMEAVLTGQESVRSFLDRDAR